MNTSNVPIRARIRLLIDEMDVVLANLDSESMRNNATLRDQAMRRINEIQKKIHELKIQKFEADLLNKKPAA